MVRARFLRAVAFSRQAPEEFVAAAEDEDYLGHPHVRTELALRRSQLICLGTEGYTDSEHLVRNGGLTATALIEVGSNHRLADPEPLSGMLRTCEAASAQRG